MSNIKRLFVEKKDAFAVEAHGLLADLRNNLGMSNLTGMRIVNRDCFCCGAASRSI